MERRTVQLRVAGQTHRVVTTATDGELKRFVATIEDRLAEVSPRGRTVHPQALLLAALALVHDLKEERERSRRIETRAREALSQLVERIDAALDAGEDAEDPVPDRARTVKPGPLRHLSEGLADLERRSLLRDRPSALDSLPGSIHLCSNDYLGYRSTGRLNQYVAAAMEEGHPVGAAASRLVSGEHQAHKALEISLADWLRTAESLIFTSGYAANVGVIAALAEAGDLIVSDSLNHASIIDGCRLSRAEVVVVRHNDVGEIARALRGSRARRRWVVTESYFSMEGDVPSLQELRAICSEWDAALVLDEAHAIGVLGPQGRGLAAAQGVTPDVLVGTLGKALGSQGAFVAGSRDLCRWLWNRARSFVFSTGSSPILAAIGRGAVAEARADDAGRERVKEVGTRFRAALFENGVRVANEMGPVLPIILGTEVKALQWSAALEKLGITVLPIRPPTVPAGTSRLRVTVRADLTDAELSTAAEAFGRIEREIGH